MGCILKSVLEISPPLGFSPAWPLQFLKEGRCSQELLGFISLAVCSWPLTKELECG